MKRELKFVNLVLLGSLASSTWGHANIFHREKPETLHEILVESKKHSHINTQKRPYDRHWTKDSEIVEWSDLKGGEYVLGKGYNESGDLVPFSIFTKTFPRPNHHYTRFWRNMFLSIFGGGQFTLGHLANYHDKKTKEEKEKAAGEYLNKLMTEDMQASFPKDWWKRSDIEWLPGKKPDLNGAAPARIAVSDLNFEKSMVKHKKSLSSFKKLLVKFRLAYEPETETLEEDDAFKDLMKHGDFVRQLDGSYLLVFERSSLEYAPTKVIDVRGRLASYPRAVSFAVVAQVCKQSANGAVLPGLTNILYTVFERYFTLVETLYLKRHAMALTMVVEALDGNKASPFYGVLNEEQLYDSVTYLKRSSTMLSNLIRIGFSSKWSLAERYLKQIEGKRVSGLQYLEDEGYKVYPFANSYYALAVRKHDGKVIELKVFSLIKTKFYGNKPFAVVDFLNPKSELRKRNAMEFGGLATSLAFSTIPFAVTILRLGFKETVIREEQRRINIEGGFQTHLNHNSFDLIDALKCVGYNQDKAEHFVRRAYEIIYEREMNPIDISHEDEQKYVYKVENWIRARNPGYTPIPMKVF